MIGYVHNILMIAFVKAILNNLMINKTNLINVRVLQVKDDRIQEKIPLKEKTKNRKEGNSNKKNSKRSGKKIFKIGRKRQKKNSIQNSKSG